MPFRVAFNDIFEGEVFQVEFSIVDLMVAHMGNHDGNGQDAAQIHHNSLVSPHHAHQRVRQRWPILDDFLVRFLVPVEFYQALILLLCLRIFSTFISCLLLIVVILIDQILGCGKSRQNIVNVVLKRILFSHV